MPFAIRVRVCYCEWLFNNYRSLNCLNVSFSSDFFFLVTLSLSLSCILYLVLFCFVLIWIGLDWLAELFCYFLPELRTKWIFLSLSLSRMGILRSMVQTYIYQFITVTEAKPMSVFGLLFSFMPNGSEVAVNKIWNDINTEHYAAIVFFATSVDKMKRRLTKQKKKKIKNNFRNHKFSIEEKRREEKRRGEKIEPFIQYIYYNRSKYNIVCFKFRHTSVYNIQFDLMHK